MADLAIAIVVVAKFFVLGEANHSLNAVVAQLRAAQKPHLQGLTKAQCGFYNTNGYLVLPDALAANEAAMLLEEARHVMEGIATGGDGIIQHVLSGTTKKPSPIGRVLATFETGQSRHVWHVRKPPLIMCARQRPVPLLILLDGLLLAWVVASTS